MPKSLEIKLFKEARKKFPGNKKRQNAYVYGTLDKIKNRRKLQWHL